jgi:RNA polymerase sigma-70 factor (ECF subfamily)
LEDDDRRLLRLCQQGDEAALSELVRRYQERVFRLAWRMLGDASLADEAAALTFVKLWTKCGSWRGESAVSTWLYRLAVRATLDVRRGQRRWWRRFVSEPPQSAADPLADAAVEVADRDEQAAAVRRIGQALSELSEADRALVHLYYFEQRGLAEIAGILGASADALKMRLARARKRLRLILEPDFTGDEKDASF